MKISSRVYRAAAKSILGLVIAVSVGVLIFVGLQVSGKNKLYKTASAGPNLALASIPVESVSPSTGNDTEVATDDNWQEGDIRYKGVHYRYNSDVLTFLFMGVDKMTQVKPPKNAIDGGQADALFLLVLDPHTKEASIIGINRDTKAEIQICTESGLFVGTIMDEICLQHAYGDGAEQSCELTVEAVSKLFYELPIHGYCAINMGAIPLLNDAVGGVKVTVLEDVINSNLKKGQEVTLRGENAYKYLHNRDLKSDLSAARRLERQKQYLAAYYATAMAQTKQDITLPVKLFTTVSKYMVTDITTDEVTYLSTQAIDYTFDSDHIYSLQGETFVENDFEAFYPDETALYELILEVFYEEVAD